jgi:uncharacterized membrane protein
MIYATLKAFHLLAIIAWVGGMFFVLSSLRPSLAVLAPPQRLALMVPVLERFLTVVIWAMSVVLLSGGAMLTIDFASVPGFRIPHAWVAMIVLGLVMMGVAGNVRGRLLKRLKAAVAAGDMPGGAAVLAVIRQRVVFNTVLGVLIVVVMRVGTGV